MWKTWIIVCEGFVTMLMLVRRSSKKKRWFSASEGRALFPWHWGFATVWIQTQGFPGNWGDFQIKEVFTLITLTTQICGTARDEPKEHSGEKLLRHCLQQQRCWVPHRAWLQVEANPWKEALINMSIFQVGVRIHCQGIHLQKGADQGHLEQGRYPKLLINW